MLKGRSERPPEASVALPEENSRSSRAKAPLAAKAWVKLSGLKGVAAVAEALAAADYITRARGGQGAVREVAELILKAQHKWSRIVAEYAE